MHVTRVARLIATGFATSMLVLAGLLPLGSAAYARGHRQRAAVDYNHNGVIFVHGFDGTGSQFESQQMRLTSNGYPDSYIAAIDYDSLLYAPALANGSSIVAQEQALFAQLDQVIANMKAVTHRPKVDLLAHSLGTKLMQDYLNSSPQRAANVAHYVNIDGMTASSPPGGVPTLALWATKGPLSPPGRSIGGAENVSIPDSTHVQCATSPLSFAAFYRFFNGKAPATTKIAPVKGPVSISGRALNFPVNNGMSGTTVQVWPISQTTGQRTSSSPIASFTLDGSGDWGPATVQSGRRYELTLVRTDNPSAPTHHYYYEPFLRNDHLVRLLESDAFRSLGGPPDPRAVGMVIIRYKELWGDQGSENDILKVNGLSVCNPTTCPLIKEVNGLFASDFNHDGQSEASQTWPPYQNSSPYFISSVDVFAAAQSPPAGVVTLNLQDRGTGPTETLTFPNFASTTDVVTAQFNDFNPSQVGAAAASTRSPAKKHHKRASKRARRSPSRRPRTRTGFTG